MNVIEVLDSCIKEFSETKLIRTLARSNMTKLYEIAQNDKALLDISELMFNCEAAKAHLQSPEMVEKVGQALYDNHDETYPFRKMARAAIAVILGEV